MAVSSVSPYIAIIGFGAIGRSLCQRAIASGFRATVLLRENAEIPAGEHDPSIVFVRSLNALIETRPMLALEAAGQAALKDIACPLLEAGIDVIAASSGIAGDAAFIAAAREAALRGGSELVFPTGAIGGIDYLTVVATASDLSVSYVSRKPVDAWIRELEALGYDPAVLAGPVVLFDGNAVDAAARYPRNMNAGLTIALAAGFERTNVRVIADPAVSLNTHELEIHSEFGDAFFRFANRPSPDNPKTSAITAESLMTEVSRRLSARAQRSSQ